MPGKLSILRCPLTVRLRPGRGPGAPPAGSWMIADRPLETLGEFLRTHSDALLDQLEIAVAESPGHQFRVILRQADPTRPPLTLPNELKPMTSPARIPDLAIPEDSKITPPLRRDFLRENLFTQGYFCWIDRDANDRLAPHRLSQSAFSPLTDRVEHTIHPSKALTPQTLNTSLFDLETFAVRENPGQPRTSSTKSRDRAAKIPFGAPPADMRITQAASPATEAKISLVQADAPIVTPNVAELERLEDQFLALPHPLDAPERTRLWREMAAGNLQADRRREAMVCQAFAVWEAEPARGQTFEAEPGISHELLRDLCRLPDPTDSESLRFAEGLIRAAEPGRKPLPGETLAEAGRSLERLDVRLPVRLAWLAWRAYFRLGGGDLLALTRARDRILTDLQAHGLRRDRDFPLFWHTDREALRDGDQTQTGLLIRLCEKARGWGSENHPGDREGVFQDWVNLTFATVIARLGDPTKAGRILEDSSRQWDATIRQAATHAQQWLHDAYQERVRQACRGIGGMTPLPGPLRERLARLEMDDRRSAERYLQFSRILEPMERVDPYRHFRGAGDELQRRIDQLCHGPDDSKAAGRAEKKPGAVESAWRELLAGKHSPRHTLRILAAALPRAARIGESFALECHDRLMRTLPKADRPLDVGEIAERVSLLENAAITMAHFGRGNLVAGLLDEWRKLAKHQQGERGALLAREIGGGSFRLMARVGLGNEARLMLAEIADSFMAGQSVREVMRRPGLNRGVFVAALSRLAAGWFYFGDEATAGEVTEVVRQELLTGQMSDENRARLAASHAFALGLAPRSFALAQFEELFSRLQLSRISFDTMAVQKLAVIESAALSLGDESIGSGSQSRRWLDEDEYLVRRRIHHDLESARGDARW